MILAAIFFLVTESAESFAIHFTDRGIVAGLDLIGDERC
ncbi:MAG: hypothetical protein ACI9E1_001433 [Cryomorphaceae bacterium]|jgi:hypothetical protein